MLPELDPAMPAKTFSPLVCASSYGGPLKPDTVNCSYVANTCGWHATRASRSTRMPPTTSDPPVMLQMSGSYARPREKAERLSSRSMYARSATLSAKPASRVTIASHAWRGTSFSPVRPRLAGEPAVTSPIWTRSWWPCQSRPSIRPPNGIRPVKYTSESASEGTSITAKRLPANRPGFPMACTESAFWLVGSLARTISVCTVIVVHHVIGGEPAGRMSLCCDARERRS
eukprot:1746906-Prymnesium_polylepis.2